MYVSLSFGAFLRLLTGIAVSAVIAGFLLAQPSDGEPAPTDVVPPQVEQTTDIPPVVMAP